MDAFLNVTLKIIAFGDKTANSNPRLRFFDLARDASGTQVQNPKSESYTLISGETKTLFSGIRATSVASNTAFTVSLSILDPSRYRFTWVSGTDPVLRTDRALTLSGSIVTVAVLANNTITATLGTGAFTGVVAGDTVLIPSTATGDSAGPFSPLNGGYWQVLAVLSSTSLSLGRPTGTDFEATSEVVTLTTNNQLKAFSVAGVQVGDKVDISAGFATATQKTFEIVTVTSTYFEVVSTTALPLESAITPTATGMIFYTDSKSFLYLEADQEAVLRLNGASDNSQRVSPIEAGNVDRPGIYMKRGPCWSLVVVNKSQVDLNLLLVHCE